MTFKQVHLRVQELCRLLVADATLQRIYRLWEVGNFMYIASEQRELIGVPFNNFMAEVVSITAHREAYYASETPKKHLREFDYNVSTEGLSLWDTIMESGDKERNGRKGNFSTGVDSFALLQEVTNKPAQNVYGEVEDATASDLFGAFRVRPGRVA